MFLKSRVFFDSVAIFLTMSFVVQAMENDDTLASHKVSLSFKGIEIPSLVEEVGMESLPYDSSQTKCSWGDLYSQNAKKLNFSGFEEEPNSGRRKG